MFSCLSHFITCLQVTDIITCQLFRYNSNRWPIVQKLVLNQCSDYRWLCVWRVQRVLETTRSVVRLELSDGVGCSTDDEFEADVLPLLCKELQSFVAVDAGFTSRSVSALVERCGRTLHQVRFVDCRRLDVDAVKAVGRWCPRLRSVAFVYRDDGDSGSQRSSMTDSQVVAALVNVAGAAELSSVAFVGFQSVCDIEVTYLADCYCATLRRVDLSNCRSLSDAALAALAERCVNRLRELSFAATRVTDAGVAALVAGCPRLQRVDLADCTALTDAAAQSLASACTRLERISLRRCHRLTSATLDSLVRHCPRLQTHALVRPGLFSPPLSTARDTRLGPPLSTAADCGSEWDIDRRRQSSGAWPAPTSPVDAR